jgi:hypothetical protein
MKDKKPRCEKCGRFVGSTDFKKDNINVKFTPDTHFTTEKTEFEHKNCGK